MSEGEGSVSRRSGAFLPLICVLAGCWFFLLWVSTQFYPTPPPPIQIMEVCKHPTSQNILTTHGAYTSKNTDNMLQHKIMFKKIHIHLQHTHTHTHTHTTTPHYTHTHTVTHTHTHTTPHHTTPHHTHTHTHTHTMAHTHTTPHHTHTHTMAHAHTHTMARAHTHARTSGEGPFTRTSRNVWSH